MISSSGSDIQVEYQHLCIQHNFEYQSVEYHDVIAGNLDIDLDIIKYQF